MKKLMFAAVAAAAGGLMAIESANVVGYQQKTTPQAKFMIGTVPFETPDGSMKLNSLLSGFTPVAIDWSLDEYTVFRNVAAQLQIWNGSTYDMAYYVSNAWYDDGTEEGAYKEGWCDPEGLLLTSYEFIPGGAYWVKNVPDSNPLTVAGAIKSASSVDFSCPTSFMLAGNAFPVDIQLNEGTQMTSANIKPVAIDWEADDYTTFRNLATQMQIWDGSKYDMAYYVSNAWYDNGTEEGAFKAGWCDPEGLLLENYTIPSGNGFWIKAASGACTLTFDNPTK